MKHFCKPFTKIASSRSTINRMLLLNQVSVHQKSKPYSTSPKEPEPELVSKSGDGRRPSTIPWQSKVANLVNLVGCVSRPIEFQESDDDGRKFWAGTTISQGEADDSTAIEIPIIFEGHLAQTAACHLKENDLIHIAGHFSEDPSQFSLECGHCIGQVMVRQISFVEETPQARERYYSRLKKVLDTFWRDLCGNPSQWTDYRKDKLNGLVKPKHPDFKRKDSGQPLWLNTAPGWAISDLPIISEEDSSLSSAPNHPEGSSSKKESEESWRNLIQNPDKWWDVRSDELFSHDFEHKDTGKALWLSSSPTWVFDKLHPAKPL